MLFFVVLSLFTNQNNILLKEYQKYIISIEERKK